MRSFDVRAAALAVEMPPKWVDNLLFLAELPGVERGRQGAQRRVSEDGLLSIEIARLLTADLGLSIRAAGRIAAAAVRSRTADVMRVDLSSGIAIVFPMSDIQTRLRRRILDAVEASVPVRRGRPPRSQASRDKNGAPDA